jgi:hypothetical protein
MDIRFHAASPYASNGSATSTAQHPNTGFIAPAPPAPMQPQFGGAGLSLAIGALTTVIGMILTIFGINNDQAVTLIDHTREKMAVVLEKSQCANKINEVSNLFFDMVDQGYSGTESLNIVRAAYTDLLSGENANLLVEGFCDQAASVQTTGDLKRLGMDIIDALERNGTNPEAIDNVKDAFTRLIQEKNSSDRTQITGILMILVGIVLMSISDGVIKAGKKS